MTQSKKRKFMLLAVILGALLLVALGTVLFNRVSAEYRSLNDADQQLLREFSQYCEQTQRADIWNGFNLSHRTVLAIGGLFQPSYLINPSAEVRSPFAVKLKMPEDIPLEVYRLSWLTPQVMKWKLSIGNFNEIGQTYRLWEMSFIICGMTQRLRCKRRVLPAISLLFWRMRRSTIICRTTGRPGAGLWKI